MPAPTTQQDAIKAFIDLANDMKNEGATVQFISTALMRACAVYSTYVVAGNEGALRKSGIEKLKNLFAGEVDAIQRFKLEQAGVDLSTMDEY
jgi:hypothetical protein